MMPLIVEHAGIVVMAIDIRPSWSGRPGCFLSPLSVFYHTPLPTSESECGREKHGLVGLFQLA